MKAFRVGARTAMLAPAPAPQALMPAVLAVFVACGGAACGGAWAAPATTDEAQRLTALFERYVGHPEGRPAVTVTPQGDSYTVGLDIGRMLDSLSAFGVEVTSGELAMNLTPQPDGLWRVKVDGLPPIGIHAGDTSTSMTWTGYGMDGLFDPTIQAFGQLTVTGTGSTSRSTGKNGVTETHLTDTATSTLKQSAATLPGAVNSESQGSLKDAIYTLSAAASDLPLHQVVRIGVTSMQTSGSIKDEPQAALGDLWQFLVAHPSRDALRSAQADLKARLNGVLPLASAGTTDATLTGLKADTSLGAFALDSVQQYVGVGGADGGGIAWRFALAGLQMPEGLLPPWSAPLLPTGVELNQLYGPLDLTGAARTAVDDLDLSADPPLTTEQQHAIVARLGGDNATLTIQPSTITTGTMQLHLQGEAHFTKPLPSGRGDLHATGLDKAIAAIRAAGGGDDPVGQQAVAMLMAAKALAKADGPDSYAWHIEAPASGDITVNGTSFAPAVAGSGTATPRPKAHKKPAP